jgi:hypothetical protein
MYGRWVTIDFGDSIECRVWVSCTPSTPEDVLQRLAMNILQSRIPQKKTGLAAGMDAIERISDYEYSQGYGTRYEIEKKLKRLLEESK